MMANNSHPRKHTHHTTGAIHKYCITSSLTPAQEREVGATTVKTISSSSLFVHLLSIECLKHLST